MSTVDWPGKIVTMVFFSGCNLRCPWCQNPEGTEKNEETGMKEIKEKLLEGIGFIDAVGFSGGEPMLQPDELLQLLEFCKKHGLETMIETNGTMPDVLAKAIDLLDFVALDIKAPLGDRNFYSKIAGTDTDVEKIRESLEILKNSGKKFEVRTTIIPGLTDSEKIIKEIASDMGKVGWKLTQFRNTKTLDPDFKKLDSPTRTRMLELARIAKSNGAAVKIWTLQSGEETV